MKISKIKASKIFASSSRQDEILRKVSSAYVQGNGLAVQKPFQVEVPDNMDIEDNLDSGQVVDVKDIKGPEDASESVEAPKVSKTGPTHSDPKSSVSFKDDASNEASANAPLENSENAKPDVHEPSTDKPEKSEKAPEPIDSSTITSLPRIDVTDNLNLEFKDIMGMLNSKDDTCGVIRISENQPNEAWIYYNDSTNLNDVMVPVIEQLNRPGYTYLSFNRLARSENAIVFIIIRNDTDRVKKPESEVSETKEN